MTVLNLEFWISSPPLGELLVAGSARGVCWVDLADDRDTLMTRLADEFPFAELTESGSRETGVAVWGKEIESYARGAASEISVPLDVRGSAFQKRVWQALRKIPRGETRSYSDVAAMLGQPRAVRAVANACGANPTPVVVPCHRVVPKAGGLGGYAKGPERKRRLLELEALPRS